MIESVIKNYWSKAIRFEEQQRNTTIYLFTSLAKNSECFGVQIGAKRKRPFEARVNSAAFFFENFTRSPELELKLASSYWFWVRMMKVAKQMFLEILLEKLSRYSNQKTKIRV